MPTGAVLPDDGPAQPGGPGARPPASTQARARLFRLRAGNVPALIAHDSAGEFRRRFAIEQCAPTFGRDAQSIIACPREELIGAEVAGATQAHLAQVLAHRTLAFCERVLTAPHGSMRGIEVRLRPHIADVAGGAAPADLSGAFVLFSDITRHRRAGRAVRDAVERLGRFMQASAEGIVFHPDGFITDANPPDCALTGGAQAERVGRKTRNAQACHELQGKLISPPPLPQHAFEAGVSAHRPGGTRATAGPASPTSP